MGSRYFCDKCESLMEVGSLLYGKVEFYHGIDLRLEFCKPCAEEVLKTLFPNKNVPRLMKNLKK